MLALLLCTHTALFAQADKMITIRKSDVPVREALEVIQKAAGTHFVYDEQSINPRIRITLDYSSPTKLSEVLDDLCGQASLRYEIKRNLILLLPAHKTGQKEDSFLLSGTVTDENGEIFLEGLRIGEYKISEVNNSASAMYILPADKEAAVQTGSTTVVEMHNELRDTPKTGDDSKLGLWLALAGVSVAGIAACGIFGFKKKKKKEDN